MIKENIEVGRDGYEKCEMNRLRTLCYLIKICIDKDLLCGNLQLKKVINSNILQYMLLRYSASGPWGIWGPRLLL